MQKNSKIDFSTLSNELPAIITRADVGRLLGRTITPGYLKNLDSEGKGPRRLRIGRKIAYLREDFLSWLAGRSEILEPGNGMEAES
jgi:hypothetical protein